MNLANINMHTISFPDVGWLCSGATTTTLPYSNSKIRENKAEESSSHQSGVRRTFRSFTRAKVMGRGGRFARMARFRSQVQRHAVQAVDAGVVEESLSKRERFHYVTKCDRNGGAVAVWKSVFRFIFQKKSVATIEESQHHKYIVFKGSHSW